MLYFLGPNVTEHPVYKYKNTNWNRPIEELEYAIRNVSYVTNVVLCMEFRALATETPLSANQLGSRVNGSLTSPPKILIRNIALVWGNLESGRAFL